MRNGSHPVPPAPVTDELWPAAATSIQSDFRSAQRTCRSLRGRLTMRETHRMGRGQTHVSHETTRLHHAARRRGGVAAWGTRAAAGDAGRWLPSQHAVAGFDHLVGAFRQGLSEAGFVDGRNVAIQQRWAEGRDDRLPALLADLVSLKAAVIVANTIGALAAKAEATNVPVVFATGSDPVRDGVVAR